MSNVSRILDITFKDNQNVQIKLPVDENLDQIMQESSKKPLNKTSYYRLLNEIFADDIIDKDEQLVADALAAVASRSKTIKSVRYHNEDNTIDMKVKVRPWNKFDLMSSISSQMNSAIKENQQVTPAMAQVRDLLLQGKVTTLTADVAKPVLYNFLQNVTTLKKEDVAQLQNTIDTIDSFDKEAIKTIVDIIVNKDFDDPKSCRALATSLQHRAKDIGKLIDQDDQIQWLKNAVSKFTLTSRPLDILDGMKLFSVASLQGFPGNEVRNALSQIVEKTNMTEECAASMKAYLKNLPSLEKRDWTMLMFVNADNNLHQFGKADIEEMERGFNKVAEHMNIVVVADGSTTYHRDDLTRFQWDGGSRVFLLEKGAQGAQAEAKEIVVPTNYDLGVLFEKTNGEINMGDKRTLEASCDFTADMAPSDKLAVVLWNHGGGWMGISWDDHGTDDHLTMVELRSALQASDKQVDLVGFDACLMQQMAVMGTLSEMGIEALVGSEENEPGEGWNYENLFNVLGATFENSDNIESTESLARGIVKAFQKGTLAYANIKMAPTFLKDMDNFGKAILDEGGRSNPNFTKILDEALHYGFKDFIDLGTFAEGIQKYMPDTKAAELAAKVREDLKVLVPEKVAPSNLTRSEGLSIYMPQYSYRAEYEAQGTNWLHFCPNWLELVKINKE